MELVGFCEELIYEESLKTYQSLDPTTNFKTANPEFSGFFEMIRLFLTKQNQNNK